MRDEEYFNIMTFGKPIGTINVVPHPEDIIDVDPFILASMKARMNGENLSNVYDLTDRSFDELSLLREKKKLQNIFGSNVQLRDAFSSNKNLKLIHDEQIFEEVDRDLLSRYSFMLTNSKTIDEYDFYRTFLFGENLLLKAERVSQVKNSDTFSILLEDYKMSQFEPLMLTKEAIQMSSGLLSLFKERKLASHFDNFLFAFYGAIDE